MSTTTLLQANCEKLLAQYNANLEAVVALQAILIRDILPSVADELELSPEATEWAKAWLEDTHTLFRICRRNNFTRSFAMESIRKNLVWRLNTLWPLRHSAQVLTAMHCLPLNVRDPFGRPILLIKALPMNITSESAKPMIIEAFERLRCHLKDLNAASAPPILQYVILLDVKDFSLAYFVILVLEIDSGKILM
ncbi:hypothetical protein H0H92_012165 [Tricholoma furcatifolium]|nr:hypothetical protein H0H92_012165 [Tricholoma furcatifolium]